MQNGLLNLAVGCHKKLHKPELEFHIILLVLGMVQNISPDTSCWYTLASIYTIITFLSTFHLPSLLTLELDK